MKDYLNFEGLRHFLNSLYEKFSAIGHTHTLTEISDFEGMVVSDDGNGNVVFRNAVLLDDTRIATLEENVEVIKETLEDNDILVADNIY